MAIKFWFLYQSRNMNLPDITAVLYQSRRNHDGYKLQTPTKCTTPRRGPLQLHTATNSHLQQTHHHSLPPLPTTAIIDKGDSQRPRMLTRFPVLMPKRPIEELGNQVRGMSCAELRDNIQSFDVRHFLEI